MITSEKINTQVIIKPKQQHFLNQPNNKYYGSWYPTAHPLKIWRYTGTNQHLGTSSHNPCKKCKPTNIVPGLPFKMLGKNYKGINKLNSVTTPDSCVLCNPTKGPVGTNSDGAKIRSAITLLNKNYYTTHNSYLKNRCKTTDTNTVLRKKDGITYFKNGKYVWPTNTENNSAIYNTNCNSDNNKCCYTTIYKPSNPQYSVQGGVTTSARIARLKYNTITNTNNSLSKQYNVNFKYDGNSNSIYFVKNKQCEKSQCCYKNRLRMRG